MAQDVNKLESAVAFKHEVTAGTPVDPAAATDYIAVSSDLSSSWEREQLESDIVTPELGQKKGQAGIGSGNANFSLEFKGSGTEGAGPEFEEALETLMGGTFTEKAVEDDVVSATTSSITVDTAEGATYPVGSAVLVKEDLGSQGYQIRPVSGVVGDVLSLGGPVLPGTPTATTTLGKFVNWQPGSAHKHATITYYWGDELKEQYAGCLFDSFNLEIATGQIIKAAFTSQAIGRTAADGSAPHTPTYDATTALVGLDVEAYIDSTLICAPTISVNIANEMAIQQCSKEETGVVGTKVKKRTVEITMNPYADDTTVTNQTAFENQTDFEFTLIFGEKDSNGYVAGKSWCLYVPRAYLIAAPYGDEDDILTEELVIRAHIGTGLPEVFINQL
jgi:hypothetical protein